MACPKCGCDTREEWWCLDCLNEKVRAARGGVTGPVPEPQPKKKLPPVHMIKEMTKDKDRREMTTITALCGVSGRPRGMYGHTKGEISSTVWPTDVTCPMCKRMPSIKLRLGVAEEEAIKAAEEAAL